MKKLFRKIAVLLAAALFQSAAWGAAITVLSMNDIHSALFPAETKISRGSETVKEMAGGAAKMLTALERERAVAPGMTLSLAAGDYTEGALLRSFNGDPEILALNRMGWDVSAIGNHEFDRGMTGFFKMLEMLKFPLISSNLVFRDPTLNAAVRQNFTKTLADGTKVGVFALMTPELDYCSSITRTGDVQAQQDVVEIAREQVRRLREDGCCAVIALTHMGFENDTLLASRVSGINAVVGGHSHTTVTETVFVKNPDGMDVPVVQTGSYGRYLGRLVLTVEGGVTRKDGTKWSLIDLNADVPEEPNLASLLARYAEQFEKELGKSIAVSLDPWDVGKEYVRRNESRVGSFFADALRWKTGTDLAFVNSGSIRGAEVYPAGNISYKTLYTIMPFVNFLTRTEMTGAQLKEFLENSASCLHVDGDGYDGSMRASTGGFLQVSGVRVTFDRSAQPALIDNSGVLRTPGERVKKVEIDRGGVYEPLDPAAVYSVTLYQWTADGGDKFYTAANLPKIDTYVTNTDVIAEYMRHFDGPFRLPPLGRMIFKN